jgi:hypothetical protein
VTRAVGEWAFALRLGIDCTLEEAGQYDSNSELIDRLRL